MEGLLQSLGQPKVIYLAIACFTSLLLAATEIAAAFKDDPWPAICNRWAAPLYAFYALLPLLIGRILQENQVMAVDSLTQALALGLGGPALLRTRVQLFQSVNGQSDFSAKADQIIAGLQEFCRAQITRDLGRASAERRETVLGNAAIDNEQLRQRLLSLYPHSEHDDLAARLGAVAQHNPQQLRPLLIALIDARDSEALDRPFNNAGHAENSPA